jgi:hypothetical protein
MRVTRIFMFFPVIFLMPFVCNVLENHKHSLGTENQIGDCPTEHEAGVLATNGAARIFGIGGR